MILQPSVTHDQGGWFVLVTSGFPCRPLLGVRTQPACKAPQYLQASSPQHCEDRVVGTRREPRKFGFAPAFAASTCVPVLTHHSHRRAGAPGATDLAASRGGGVSLAARSLEARRAATGRCMALSDCCFVCFQHATAWRPTGRHRPPRCRKLASLRVQLCRLCLSPPCSMAAGLDHRTVASVAASDRGSQPALTARSPAAARFLSAAVEAGQPRHVQHQLATWRWISGS